MTASNAPLSPIALSVKDLHKSFGPMEVLKGISLDAHEGDVVSILGSSGSGKSTLIRCINGLEKLNGGQITVDEFDVGKPRELAEARKRSGTVFQLFNLYPHMTVLGNILNMRTLKPFVVWTAVGLLYYAAAKLVALLGTRFENRLRAYSAWRGL